jgi:8-oxo-dGTP pyrophosphatase MutT (NUDIX family)
MEHEMKTTCGVFLVCNSKILIGHVTNTENDWSIPKGLMDEGETEIESMLRELKEETDIDADHITVHPVEPIYEVYAHKKKKLCAFLAHTDCEHDAICYSMVTSREVPFPEIDHFKWADYTEAMEKIHPTQKTVLTYYLTNGIL